MNGYELDEYSEIRGELYQSLYGDIEEWKEKYADSETLDVNKELLHMLQEMIDLFVED